MNPIIPLNRHLMIRPLASDEFIHDTDTTYEERGEILAIAKRDLNGFDYEMNDLMVGDIVYFDAWCIAKYPNGKRDDHGNALYDYFIPFDKIRGYQQCTTRTVNVASGMAGSTIGGWSGSIHQGYWNTVPDAGIDTSGLPTSPTTSISPTTSAQQSSPMTQGSVGNTLDSASN